MAYDFLADLIVAFHFGYVAFVILGQVAIFIGFTLKWNWIRNFWFRLIHLIAITLVGLEAVFGIDCPLTGWEGALRRLAGHDAAEGSFVGRCLDYFLFYDVDPRILNGIHIGFAVLVIATLVLIPPRWPWRRQPTPLPHSHTAPDSPAATHQR
jgi:hypothetical protein